MLFDINTAVGHWPFRQIPNQTLPELRRYLVSQGIGGAAVSSTNAVFYKNTQDGNLEIARELEDYDGFFVGVATLNPLYAAWERDLETCAKLGFRALRMLPKYHAYEWSAPEAQAMIAKAGELEMPILVPHELVNYRQRHHLEPEKPLNFNEFLKVAEANPNTNFIYMETGVKPDGNYPKNLYFEMSRYRSSYGDVLATLVKNVGADHVLFGTGSPFKAAEPAILKLHTSKLFGDELELISSENAKRLLKL